MPGSGRSTRTRLRMLLVVCAALALQTAGPADADVSTTTIDGPTPDISTGVHELEVAPDGSAAVVYLKKDAGVEHVFAATYDGRQWSAPQRLDQGLAAASQHPDVGVGSGGRVVATFLNDGRIYSAFRQSDAEPFQLQPIVDPMYTGFKRLNVDVAADGVAYATYIDFSFDVRASRLDGAVWSPVGEAHPGGGGILNNDPNKQAKTDYGTAPSVGGSGAAVAWSEPDAANVEQVYVRQLSGATPGALQRASIDDLAGRPREAFADMADLDGDGQGNHVVVFRETFEYGAAGEPRVLARRLSAVGDLGDAQVVDGLPEVIESGAELPDVDVNGSGDALIGQRRQEIVETWGSAWSAGMPASTFLLDPTVLARSAAALSDAGSGLFAWSREAGGVIGRSWSSGQPGEEFMLSVPEFGEGGDPPRVAADAQGISMAAFVQGAAAERRVVVARVEPPAPVAPPGSGAGDATPPVVRSLKVKPRRVPRAGRLPKLLPPGRRTRPHIRFSVSEAAGIRIRFAVRTRRRWVPVRGSLRIAAAEGTNRVRFHGRLKRRRYLRPGAYRLTALATDPAGNRSRPRRTRFRLLPR